MRVCASARVHVGMLVCIYVCEYIYIYTCWYDVCMYIGRYMSACDGGDGGDGGDGDGDGDGGAWWWCTHM